MENDLALPFDLSGYRVDGATRPDSISGMQKPFSTALAQMFAAAPEEIRNSLRISSGYRSSERQSQLYEAALKKYGSPEAARKWVAPPGHSEHNAGDAADLKYLSPEAETWAHANAGKYGLTFPLSNENWHIELEGARGQPEAAAAPATAATPANALSPPATANLPGEAPVNTNDLTPAAQPAAPAPQPATDAAGAGAASPAGVADGKKQMMKLLLLSSLANVRLQPVDYDPYAVMPHFS